MLRPEYLAGAADSVVEVYSQVEQDIAEDIARRIVKNGGMTQTARWQAYKGREFGFFQEDVDMIMSKASPKAKKEIQEIMAEAAEMSLSYDDSIYISAGLSPTAIRKSPAMMAMLLQGTDSTLALLGNFTKTTAIMSTIGFNNILDRAYMQILSGAFDPNTAIRRAVKEIASKGVDKIAYPSGASTSVEAAVRRAVTTGVNQSVAKLQLARAEEMGCNLVETSSHAGARPTHAEWQGQVFCIKGHHKHYGDFYKETGYGTGDGLCGWNCYHSFFPYFEGLSTPSFSRDPAKEFLGKDNDEMYREQQKQRYYERQIRAAKKECAVYSAAMNAAEDEDVRKGLQDDLLKASNKLRQRESALNRFIAETGRTKDPSRVTVGGWNRNDMTTSKTKISKHGITPNGRKSIDDVRIELTEKYKSVQDAILNAVENGNYELASKLHDQNRELFKQYQDMKEAVAKEKREKELHVLHSEGHIGKEELISSLQPEWANAWNYSYEQSNGSAFTAYLSSWSGEGYATQKHEYILLEGIKHSGAKYTGTMYRGMSVSDDFVTSHAVGGKFIQDGLSSWSSSIDSAMEFAYTDKTPVLLIVEGAGEKNAISIKDFSKAPWENEVLSANRDFVITGIKKEKITFTDKNRNRKTRDVIVYLLKEL